MIKEAYVSFEVAKLLKEKGFNWECEYCYNLPNNNPYSNADYKVSYPKPTHQMAMAWLREVHHIAINIGWGEIFEDQYKWWCIVLNMDNCDILYEINHHASYEEAVEEALKYTLEKTICS